jgi:uncharacterized membrane protein YfcA
MNIDCGEKLRIMLNLVLFSAKYGSVFLYQETRMWFIHLSEAGTGGAAADVWVPGLLLLGLAVGLLAGLFGAGGGFLLTPFLNIFFGIGYPLAVGSSLAQIFVTGSLSAWKHCKRKSADLRLGLILGLSAICGTRLGKAILDRLASKETITLNGRELPLVDLALAGCFLVLMTAVATVILREKSGAPDPGENRLARKLQAFRLPPMLAFPHSNIAQMSFWLPPLIGFAVGVLTGLLGIGGGFVNFPLLVYVLGIPTHVAVGTSALQIVFAAGYGGLANYFDGNVSLTLVGILLAGSVIGTQVGVQLAHKLHGAKLRKYFAAVIILGIIVIVADAVRKIWL